MDRIRQEVQQLYEKDAAGMLRYALALAGDAEAARDAVQEAFLRLFIMRSAGQEIRSPRAWVYRVLHNHVLDQKKAGSRNEVGLESLANAPVAGLDPEADYSRFELLRRTLVQALTPREIECVRLRAEGLGYEEIAEVLGVRSGTIGALLTRAHKKIRQAAGERSGTFGLAMTARKRYAS
ncbi:MAG: RNA polymerase sigma factor [Acidobacteriota bacterium]